MFNNESYNYYVPRTTPGPEYLLNCLASEQIINLMILTSSYKCTDKRQPLNSAQDKKGLFNKALHSICRNKL